MPTTPQDHRPSEAETAATPFTFDHDGATFSLPPASSIKAGMIRRLRKLDDLDMAFSILEELADQDALTALDDMSIDEFNQVLGDWQGHIGVNPGKS